MTPLELADSAVRSAVSLPPLAGRSVTVHHVTVTTDTPGFTAEIQSGDTATGPFQTVSDSQTVTGQTTFDLRDAHACAWSPSRRASI